jgi:adenine-specific DNA methylase
LEKPFERNMEALERRFSSYLAREEQYHATHALEDVVAGNTDLPYVGNDEQLARERLGLAEEPHTFPYRLATITFAGAYFGCKQCMEIDSLRYSIDSALAADHIDAGQRDWLLIALGRAMSRINNSTGQFAQYLKPRLANVHRILKQRSRSASKEFLQAFGSLSPIGTEEWRSRNCSFQCDALSLLASLGPSGCRPAIVYADPPYSPAQYSRYYHVLDVITEYSYPAVSGVGRYPSNRYQTPFAHSGRVLSSLSELVERVRALDACLVLSYPKNGLFVRQGGNVLELLRKHYGNAFLVFADEQEHSTFGGPNATPKVSVVEQIFMAYV